MAKILIMPQDWPERLHEWVAIERGYFDEVGLEYSLRLAAGVGRAHSWRLCA